MVRADYAVGLRDGQQRVSVGIVRCWVQGAGC
jgi:hypothetical protein